MTESARYPSGMTKVEFLVVLAFAVGGLIRLLKADRLNMWLAKFSLPPIPKKALPWIAVGLGIVAAVVESLIKGVDVVSAIRNAVMGALAGGFATWGHEAGVESVMGGEELGGQVKPPVPPQPDDDVPPVDISK